MVTAVVHTPRIMDTLFYTMFYSVTAYVIQPYCTCSNSVKISDYWTDVTVKNQNTIKQDRNALQKSENELLQQ